MLMRSLPMNLTRRADGQFPLTPALSLRERVERFPVLDIAQTPGSWASLGFSLSFGERFPRASTRFVPLNCGVKKTLPQGLPLPRGEGRGEGELAVRTSGKVHGDEALVNTPHQATTFFLLHSLNS